MKTYFIDKIEGKKVNIIVTSISELESAAIRFVEHSVGRISNFYVHCSQILNGNTTDNAERNIDYVIRVDNRKRTITTKRI